MGPRAKWEYFRVVYVRYREAVRESKHLILNEFCLNTGYHHDSASERAASGEGTAAAKAAEGQLWPSRGSDSGVRYGSILVRLIRLIRLAPAIAEAKYVSPTRKHPQSRPKIHPVIITGCRLPRSQRSLQKLNMGPLE